MYHIYILSCFVFLCRCTHVTRVATLHLLWIFYICRPPEHQQQQLNHCTTCNQHHCTDALIRSTRYPAHALYPASIIFDVSCAGVWNSVLDSVKVKNTKFRHSNQDSNIQVLNVHLLATCCYWGISYQRQAYRKNKGSVEWRCGSMARLGVC